VLVINLTNVSLEPLEETGALRFSKAPEVARWRRLSEKWQFITPASSKREKRGATHLTVRKSSWARRMRKRKRRRRSPGLWLQNCPLTETSTCEIMRNSTRSAVSETRDEWHQLHGNWKWMSSFCFRDIFEDILETFFWSFACFKVTLNNPPPPLSLSLTRRRQGVTSLVRAAGSRSTKLGGAGIGVTGGTSGNCDGKCKFF